MDVAVGELLSNYLLVTELLKKVSSCTFDLKNENVSPIECLRRCRQPQSGATECIIEYSLAVGWSLYLSFLCRSKEQD